MTVKRKRHAFLWERVLILVALESDNGLKATKRAMACVLGCCPDSLDRVITGLARDGLIEREPVYDANGARTSTIYRATARGAVEARRSILELRDAEPGAFASRGGEAKGGEG